jgi:DNA-binding transcriptional regulator LsrR (DeoR family)
VLVTDGLVEIHTDHGVTGRSEFEDRLAACAGMAPAAIVERLAAATNVNDDDVAILAVQATRPNSDAA